MSRLSTKQRRSASRRRMAYRGRLFLGIDRSITTSWRTIQVLHKSMTLDELQSILNEAWKRMVAT